jgi:SAM-dependent methyltransferase
MDGSNTLSSNAPYTDAFYHSQGDRSYQSAACVLPLVLSLAPVRSAIDVGCGVGTWASRLLEYGVADVLGIDGDYVNRDLLRIPREYFQAFDLSKPISIDRRFDLAVCLEVAEHLPPSRSEGLVEDLTKLAPIVLFSAAIPGQSGTDHINEQYLSYWADLFRAHEYVLLDILRPKLWEDERCDWWYRQNAVVFTHKDNPLAGLRVDSVVDCVHPRLLELKREEFEVASKPTLGASLGALPGSVSRSLRTRLGRIFAGSR